MKKPSPKVGDEIRLRILDHVEGSDDVEEFYVYGRVAKVNRQAITVDSWSFVDPKVNRDAERENITTFTILRRVVNHIKIFPGDES